MMTFLVALAVVLGWAFVDVREQMRWFARLSSLAADGRVDEIPAECERGLASRRLFAVIFRRLVLPGAVEAQCALCYHQLGNQARAVELADQAIARTRPGTPMRATAHAVRLLALLSLGRYDEAKQESRSIRAIPGFDAALLCGEANLHLAQCHFTDALAVAREVLAAKPVDEAAHVCGASALGALGRFDEALAMLVYDVRGMAAFYTAKQRKDLDATDAGRELFEAQERERAAVVKPMPHIQSAAILLDANDVGAADTYLHRARDLLGKNVVVGFHFHATRARALAMRGDAAGAEAALKDAGALVAKLPDARGFKLENHLARARCFAALSRWDAVLDELRQCESVATHPFDWLQVHYWLALALEGAGRPTEAATAWSSVLSTSAEGWMRARAEKSDVARRMVQ